MSPYVAALYHMGLIYLFEQDFQRSEKFFVRSKAVGEESMGPDWIFLDSIQKELRRAYVYGEADAKARGRVGEAKQFDEKLRALSASKTKQ
jgi:hypothetical protein